MRLGLNISYRRPSAGCGIGRIASRLKWRLRRPAISQMSRLPRGEVSVPLRKVDHILPVPFGHRRRQLLAPGR